MEDTNEVTLTEAGTPICDNPLDNIYADMLRRSGMRCDSREELIEFLAAMMDAHDTVKRLMAEEDGNVVRYHNKAPALIMERLQAGDSIIDVAVEFGGDFQSGLRMLCGNQPTIMEEWPEEFWAHIEEAVQDSEVGEWSRRTLTEAFDITPTQAQSLLRWYGKGKTRSKGGRV